MMDAACIVTVITTCHCPYCIQVYRGHLTCADGQLIEVAVKVRHPGVARLLQMDFMLMKLGASFIDALPLRALRNLRVTESVAQFSTTMTAQADLRVEAAHLERLLNNFASVSNEVRFTGNLSDFHCHVRVEHSGTMIFGKGKYVMLWAGKTDTTRQYH
jgi:hypothetical protein